MKTQPRIPLLQRLSQIFWEPKDAPLPIKQQPNKAGSLEIFTSQTSAFIRIKLTDPMDYPSDEKRYARFNHFLCFEVELGELVAVSHKSTGDIFRKASHAWIQVQQTKYGTFQTEQYSYQINLPALFKRLHSPNYIICATVSTGLIAARLSQTQIPTFSYHTIVNNFGKRISQLV